MDSPEPALALRMGVMAEDLVTGFQGMVTRKVDMLTGTTQWALTPRCIDASELKEGQYVDEVSLKVTGAGIADTLAPADTTTFLLGDFVKDQLTNLKGTVVEIATYLNGCIYLTVQPKIDPMALSPMLVSIPDAVTLQHERFVKAGAPILAPKKPKPKAEKPPGGPPRRIRARRVV